MPSLVAEDASTTEDLARIFQVDPSWKQVEGLVYYSNYAIELRGIAKGWPGGSYCRESIGRRCSQAGCPPVR